MAGDRQNKLTRRRTAAVRHWFSDSELSKEIPKYDPEVIEAICVEMVENGTPLPDICKNKAVKGAPSTSELYRWMKADPRIAQAIGAARSAQAEMKWTSFGTQIEEEFDAAIALGDKNVVHATEKKMALLMKHRLIEVQKLVPGIYGEQRKDKGAGNFTDMLRQAREEGLIVKERVLEVPAKADKAPPEAKKSSDNPTTNDNQRDVVIDLPAKRRVK